MSARFTLFSAATAVVLAPLLYDAALKGVLLLAAAGLVVLGLRRASAAARHLVWLVAMVALVLVPVLTVALPRWRVLPAWAAWPKPPVDAPHRHRVADPGLRVATSAPAPPLREFPTMTSTSDPAPIVSRERPSTAPSLPARVPVRAPAPPVSAATWAVAAWTAGFLLFSVRLLAAHCLLRRTRRRAEPCSSGPLAEALAEAAIQLGVRPPVSLRLDARRTIPLVWGVLRPCLVLPAEARDWSRDQLRSVLLHELAHLKRRDPLVQALAQVALALHWFNPLAWLAVWRLHVERERACDDLVLASGVRSSDYATHLLRVATELTPAPWTSACGLAMARRSSLEARLRAVLNDRCNRRAMTRVLTAASLLLALVLAIPVAMLRATEETWNPPNAAHIVTNSFSAYCVHGLKDVAFVLAYPGQTSSSSAHDSNAQTRTWTDTGTFTAIQPDIALGFFRQHTAPDTLILTTTPASARYLSKPAPPPRPFGQTTFDLTQGRVFLLADNATIRQIDLPAPLVTDTGSAQKLAALIAALPPPALETERVKPNHESAQSLFQKWQSRARTNGRIPGALVRQLSRQVTEFINQSPDTDEAKKLAALRPRFEAAAARDWGPAEAAGLLDDVAAITTAPLDWSSLPMEFDAFSAIKTGETLPAELASEAWGTPADNGLRAAWLLEPRAEQYALGTVLKVRVLFHNAGSKPVVFRTETWHQSDALTVRDAQGADVKTTGTWYTGITPLANYRLLPGEYCEVSAPGVALGAGPYEDERSTGGLGLIIEAKEGDVLSLSCLVDAAQGITFSRPNDPKDPLVLWKKQVADRIASEAPLPSSPADREQLLRRVLLDLTGEPPTAAEIAQFVNDSDPNALDTLTARLQAKEPTLPWTGKLPTGTTQFRVLAADPEAAKAPRSANGPGRYVLGDSAHLFVRQVTEGGKRTNAAQIVFFGPDPKKESPYEPHAIALPDGLGTYGIVWERGAGGLWVLEKDVARKFGFSNPSQVQETRLEPGRLQDIPAHLQEAMRKAFPGASESAPAKDAKPSGAGTSLDPATEAQLDWGEPVKGLRGALLIRAPGAGKAEGIHLVVQNVSDAPVRFVDTVKTERLRTLYLSDTKGVLAGLSNDEPTMTDVTLQPREVVFLSIMPGDSSAEVTAGLIEGLRKDSLQTWRAVLRMSQAPEGWQGELTTGETRSTVREGGPQPKNERAQALFKYWQTSARLNGDIPGGLVALLHEKVQEFIRNNEPDASGGPYAQKMKPLEPRFAHTGDWKPADVVALLDDIAAAHTIPLETTLQHLSERTLQPGTSLPASLQNADWGEPLPSGLRMAHVLEPRAGGYPLGTELKARLVFHNAGPEPVAFITTTFQQPVHAAQRADGANLQIDSTSWTTLGRLAAYRLAPGESCELHTPGLGIGARDKDRDDWANVRAGSWILCAEGDEVVFTPGAAALSYRDMAEPSADWWLAFITERLNREAPVPTDTKEREYLLYRVVRDLYGTAPSTTEGDAFAADTSPDALKNLAALLAKHPYGKRSDGLIRAGTTKFRVLPPDTDAAQRPRVATGPGWYSLSDSVKFSVTRRAAGTWVRNEANLIHFQQGKENVTHTITLPDGHDTWAAASMKDATVLWIAEAGTLRRYEFSNPLKVEETRYEAGKLGDAPISKELRAALDAVLSNPAPDAPKLKQPTPPAAEAPAAPPSEKSDASQWDIRQHDGRDYVTLESFAKFYRLTRTERVADGFRLSSSQMAIAGTPGQPVVTINGISFALDHPIIEVTDALLVSRADVGLLFDPVLRPHAQNSTFNGTVILDPTGDGLNLAMVWAREVQNKLSAAGFTVLLTRGAEARGDAEASLRPAAAHPGAVMLGLDFKNASGAEIHGPETRMMSAAVPESLRKVSSMLATAVHGHMRMKLATEDRGIRSGDELLLTQSAIPAIVLEAGCLSNARDFNQWNDPSYRERAAEAVAAGMKAFQRSVNAPKSRTGDGGSLEKQGAATLTPQTLLGTWRGMVNNERLILSFHRPPAETEVQLDIYFGDATIGALATFTFAEDGGSAEVVQASAGGGMKFGTLVPSEAGQLKLELYGRQKGQQEVMLTRDADAVANAPRHAEARALFEMWQRTANVDGTIPGTFIGQLATAVRAFVRHNPTLDSGMKLQKLLPRFVTTRDWTPAEAAQLLDDVQYYHFQPIMDRVAKAKLPSGPLWRTMVEFQDLPVEIEKWSDPLRGLRLGMRVVEADWHLGGRARLELWLHNAGDQDVTFKSTGPDRQDAGVSVVAIGTDGREHWSSERSVLIIAPPTDCTLPPGHVAMAKSFEVWISRPDDTSAEWKALNLRDLSAGNYRLRCSWLDAAGLAEGAEWKGTLTAPELEFTLAPQVPKSAVAPAPTRVPGGPRAEVKPERTHLWNDTYAAVGYQTEKDVHFVLVTDGFISTGLSESWSDTSKRWTIEGNIHLVDPEKTKAAGQNVDKRVIALKHTSDEPTKLYLDGKAYDLATPAASGAKGVAPPPGRLFILREQGDPIQTDRTLPLRNEQDLATIGDATADVRATFQN